MTLNGITLEWKAEDDLPSMCCQCPFFFSGSTNVTGLSSVSEMGICNLRGMNKKRWADCPQACLRLFRKVFKYPEDAALVVVLKDD
ncbi:MAG: hypothetical protein IK076_02325 [Bacteroidales bacterium]|nr:hypothetical protein [Bacteroidales bacterium]